MARAHRLHGLALAAIGRAPQGPVLARAYRVATIPEFRGDPAVARIFQHARFLAALYFPSNFRGKLKMVAAVVDGPRPIRLHQNWVVGGGDQILVAPRSGENAGCGDKEDWRA